MSCRSPTYTGQQHHLTQKRTVLCQPALPPVSSDFSCTAKQPRTPMPIPGLVPCACAATTLSLFLPARDHSVPAPVYASEGRVRPCPLPTEIVTEAWRPPVRVLRRAEPASW
ncbi:hypothetical protein PsYK624_114440 [Phanerochaete sordida]|uniref:Uncharacterized protein n=1 Tax=Phanerochaete sordida TaxID=48140 RepID=A0A9P3LH79_9APHY|nr:hypothetical protein PsYK624_114440 [Phanerochaete sordida]